MRAAGWDITEADEEYFVAAKERLRVFVINEDGLSVKVIRSGTGPVVAAGVFGALGGALIAVGLVVIALVLLIPAILWTVYRLLPDGVTIAHNYVAEPFWRGFTGEPRAVPSLIVGGVALLVILIPWRTPALTFAAQSEGHPRAHG